MVSETSVFCDSTFGIDHRVGHCGAPMNLYAPLGSSPEIGRKHPYTIGDPADVATAQSMYPSIAPPMRKPRRESIGLADRSWIDQICSSKNEFDRARLSSLLALAVILHQLSALVPGCVNLLFQEQIYSGDPAPPLCPRSRSCGLSQIMGSCPLLVKRGSLQIF